MTDLHAAIGAAIAEDEYWAKLAAQSLVRVNVPLPHGEHIERHGPSRVLRQVKAYRLILALHRPSGVNGNRCATCCDAVGSALWWPCDTVKALASIYESEVD